MKRFAVLIDADNSSHRNIEAILEEIAKYGIASVKRIYGDWSVDSLQSWRDKLLPNAITPVQQFAYVAQKDATDMRLVIDAMDLLYAGDLDGFCIISSDSDFTPLASRIRESGLLVYGFGEKKTVSSFVNACDKFIYVENLDSNIDTNSEISNSHHLKSDNHPKPAPTTDEKKTINNVSKHKDDIEQSTPDPNKTDKTEIDLPTLNLIYRAIKDNSDDDGWASLSAVGTYINNVKPDFDPRTYGRSKLSTLLKKLVKFETKIENSQMFVRKFNFTPFIEKVQKTIKRLNNVNKDTQGWVKLPDLVQSLAKQPNEPLNRLSDHDIEQKVLAIYSNVIEISKDGNLVRMTP